MKCVSSSDLIDVINITIKSLLGCFIIFKTPHLQMFNFASAHSMNNKLIFVAGDANLLMY